MIMSDIISPLEIRVLKEIYGLKKRNIIRKELGLTTRGIARICNKLKELGFTRIQGYGGSGCTCTISENQNYCDCGGSPFVGRHTVISEAGKIELRKHVNHSVL